MAIFLLPIIVLAAGSRGQKDDIAGAGILGGPTNLMQEHTSNQTENGEFGILFAAGSREAERDSQESTMARGDLLYVWSGEQETRKIPADTHIIESGEDLSDIAGRFAVSEETIVLANPSIARNRLSPGKEIQIPWQSGVFYKMKEGEFIEDIATRLGVAIEDIAQANPGIDLAAMAEGEVVFLPGDEIAMNAKPKSVAPPQAAAKPEAKQKNSYFIYPAEGKNWGKLHGHNAVDIAAPCGTPVVASASGVVVPDLSIGPNEGLWNGGYGKFVMLEHPNGTKTRYAHLQKIFVEVGQMIVQGEVLGEMGRTGEATGCHVHFEVYGIRNPFVR
jgi:murein DD-endopeptidase MepM/ murein hydrolase activator NlpD